MILVTGGCFQGKTDYACETFHIAKEEAADGMDCPMEAIYETKLLYHFHEYIKRCMEANQELDLEVLRHIRVRRSGCRYSGPADFLRSYHAGSG